MNVEMLDRIAINDLVPGLRLDDGAGGRFGAADGYGHSLQALAGFAAFATLGGVTIREGVAVRALVRNGDRVTGVRTDEGELSADRVLLATGAWTAPLAATADVAVPMRPYCRSIIETQPIPELRGSPLIVEVESGLHVRPKGALIRLATPNITPEWKIEEAPRRHRRGTPATIRRSRSRPRSSRGCARAPHGAIRRSRTCRSARAGSVTTK